MPYARNMRPNEIRRERHCLSSVSGHVEVLLCLKDLVRSISCNIGEQRNTIGSALSPIAAASRSAASAFGGREKASADTALCEKMTLETR